MKRNVFEVALGVIGLLVVLAFLGLILPHLKSVYYVPIDYLAQFLKNFLEAK